MDNCGFGVFAIRGKECPEDTRYRGKVSDKSGWDFYHITFVVTEVEGERLVYPPVVMAKHFENGRSCESAHGFLSAVYAMICKIYVFLLKLINLQQLNVLHKKLRN